MKFRTASVAVRAPSWAGPRAAFAASLSLLMHGCATGPELRDVSPMPELTEVPFFAQEAYQCGPAALATVLSYSGAAVTPQQLAPSMFVPERQGSLQAELLATARSHGRVPYRLKKDPEALLDALRAGQPVLVFQNLGYEIAPIWHYAVLIGYEPGSRNFVLRSGTVARHTTSARRFMASWERAERWAFVVVPASEPPANADPLSWLEAVAPFESTGHVDLAAQGYRAAVQRWPDDPRTWTALGNARYLQDDLASAEVAYERALALSPDHWIARNNLIQTLMARGCPAQAQSWVATAGSPPERFAPTWHRTLEKLSTVAQHACETAVGHSVGRDAFIDSEASPRKTIRAEGASDA